MSTEKSAPTPVGGLYDQQQLADLIGVSRGALRTARVRNAQDFPPPLGELNRGPVWDAAEAKEWAANYVKRAPGRPPTK